MIIALIILAVLTVIVFILFIKSSQKIKNYKKEIAERTQELEKLKDRYKDIIDVDATLYDKNEQLRNINQNIANLVLDYQKQNEQLNQDFIGKRNIYENLLKEISIVEENLEDISYGLYKPHFNYSSSDEYKQKLEEIWTQEKDLIKSDKAIYRATEWTINGNKAEGRKMAKHQSKLMLRAFNGECDSAVAKVNWSNIGIIETRIAKAYEAINNLGSTQNISITKEYLDLKLQELRLEFELQEKIHQEKEEQKKIREQMREEQKVQIEMEKARQNAEQEEAMYQKALEKAKADLSKTTGAELDILNGKIKTLEENLQIAQEQKARAISRAQQTKSGHVYIISNIGSFGENVYKFGMTRRLDPQDRIDELGNASVPFDFDVHGLVYTENAPELENKLHSHLNDKRINLVHLRREFFNVTIEEIEQVIKEFNLDIQLTKLAEAKEYRMSQSIRESKQKQALLQTDPVVTKELDKFPKSLN
jgi:type II secretory pathway pseudopilin PulG